MWEFCVENAREEWDRYDAALLAEMQLSPHALPGENTGKNVRGEEIGLIRATAIGSQNCANPQRCIDLYPADRDVWNEKAASLNALQFAVSTDSCLGEAA